MDTEGTAPSGLGRRWKKTPAEVASQLDLLWAHYRGRHDPDPAEVVEDIFTDLLDLVTGFCHPDASWTEPDEPEAGEPPRHGRE